MLRVPTALSSADVADWLEASCLRNGRGRASRSEALDQLIDYGVPDHEDLCASAWLELNRRSTILGKAYPFRIGGTRIERSSKSSGFLIYTMLLLLTIADLFQESRIKTQERKLVSKLFEKVTAAALGRYVGGKSLCTGHPREEPVPSRFNDLLGYLSSELRESSRRLRALNPDTKDCKADVVVWRPFPDERGGQIVVMAQCATGKNWRTKLTELNVGLWERYIEFVVSPIRAFAIPFVESDPALWLEYGTLGGIALDRLRITRLAVRRVLPTPIRTQIRMWTREKLAAVPVDY